MSLYPSLEDLKVDKVIQAQTAYSANPASQAFVLVDASAALPPDGNLYPKLYPELSQYMGLSLNEAEICESMPMVSGAPAQGLVARPSSVNYMVAPVTGNDAGTVVTITIMPTFIFEHIIKRMAPSIMKSLMDHTIPEV